MPSDMSVTDFGGSPLHFKSLLDHAAYGQREAENPYVLHSTLVQPDYFTLSILLF